MGGLPTGLLVADVDVQAHDDGVGEQRGHPVNDKHDTTAQDGPRQRNPHVVVLEARTPSYNTNERRLHTQQRLSSHNCHVGKLLVTMTTTALHKLD